ncbi:MAG: hypothetical protein mread185_000157 [Mycoplasmataceae bacterium]|nr:MAG: hypothetical protein mread185_000157 [Mycoplasmataceae bacterium]
MTNNNQYYIPKLPETETVSYFDVNEWDKGLTEEQLEQQKHLDNVYESEYQHQGLTGPQYGPGGEGWKMVSGVAMRTLAVACPPAALFVGAGVAISGASYAIGSAIDKDPEGVMDGIAFFGIGMGGAVGGASGAVSHNPDFCIFSAVCPKSF